MKLRFCSPDPYRAEQLAARLKQLAMVRWENLPAALVAMPSSLTDGQHVILLDFAPDAVADSAELARRLLTRSPELPLVGVGSTEGAEAAGVLAALRAGVLDFIDPNMPDEEIRSLLARMREAAAQGRLRAPVQAPAPVARGRIVLLLGVRPGIGTSTLAAHLGVSAMGGNEPDTQRQVLLLELGRPAGDAALYLGVEGEFQYSDALRGAHRIDATLIRTALGRHTSQLAVLSQRSDLAEPPRSEDDSGTLMERLRNHFELLLCDLGGLPLPQVPLPLLQLADEIWLVADQSIGSMVSLDAALRELGQRGLRDERLSLVINRYDREGGMEPEQVARRFGLPLLAVLPERSRVLRASANQGLLLQQIAPRDSYLRAMRPLLERLQPATAATAQAPRPRWLARLGGFRWKNQ
ncbi:AAA family ATPase [Dyella agri]|uniref:Fimbrial protein n=1 Tax=Dyella agri TaxID=1926869 RepID=A0ABW8KJM3_9GAMM